MSDVAAVVHFIVSSVGGTWFYISSKTVLRIIDQRVREAQGGTDVLHFGTSFLTASVILCMYGLFICLFGIMAYLFMLLYAFLNARSNATKHRDEGGATSMSRFCYSLFTGLTYPSSPPTMENWKALLGTGPSVKAFMISIVPAAFALIASFLYYLSLHYVGIVVAMGLKSLNIVFAAPIRVWVFKRKFGSGKWVGVILIFSAMGLFALSSALDGQPALNPNNNNIALGIILCVLSAFTSALKFVAEEVVIKRRSKSKKECRENNNHENNNNHDSNNNSNNDDSNHHDENDDSKSENASEDQHDIIVVMNGSGRMTQSVRKFQSLVIRRPSEESYLSSSCMSSNNSVTEKERDDAIMKEKMPTKQHPYLTLAGIGFWRCFLNFAMVVPWSALVVGHEDRALLVSVLMNIPGDPELVAWFGILFVSSSVYLAARIAVTKMLDSIWASIVQIVAIAAVLLFSLPLFYLSDGDYGTPWGYNCIVELVAIVVLTFSIGVYSNWTCLAPMLRTVGLKYFVDDK